MFPQTALSRAVTDCVVDELPCLMTTVATRLRSPNARTPCRMQKSLYDDATLVVPHEVAWKTSLEFGWMLQVSTGLLAANAAAAGAALSAITAAAKASSTLGMRV